ncbi:MAG: DVUA0089 family protein [Gammaproteobacteria bacterium]
MQFHHFVSRRLPLGVLLFTGIAGPTQAATLSFGGSLVQDDSVGTFSFTLSDPGTVTLRTFSYAGGTSGNGAVISPGGFDLGLSLFDGGGNLLLNQEDATPECDGVASDPVTNECFDSLLVTALAAGDYLVAITQFDNRAMGPSFANGFSQTGANFTAIFGCVNGQFCDVDADSRTAAWAADVSGVTVVPAPAAGWLLGSAIGFIGVARGRRAT